MTTITRTSIPWTYLSKKGTDEYVNRLAASAGVPPMPVEDWYYDLDPDHGIVLRGIMKHKIMKQCWKDGRPFRYMDTGYFGNQKSGRNPNGYKIWHRIVENDLQHGDILQRPADRWQQLGIDLEPQKKGRKILIVAPDEKPCTFYGTTLEQWLKDTESTIRKHTDRPVEIRHRAKDAVKNNRDKTLSFEAALRDDVAAIVTFNSTASIQAIMLGVPVFVTGAANAARPVSNQDLTRIDSPEFPNDDLRLQWLHHLAYGQFSVRELENGTALRILDETREMLADKK